MTIHIDKEVPCVGHYDVAVCGAGTAGWVAAVAAARAGRRTALLERYGFCGGTASGGLVIPISGFFKNGERLVGGIPWEFITEMEQCGAVCVEWPKGHISVDTEYYKLLAQRMVLAAGVDVFFDCFVSGAVREGERIGAVVFESKSGTQALSADYFIDATGDADLFALCGLPTVKNPDPQPLSLCFELTGVDTDTPLLRDYIHHDGKVGPSCHPGIREYLSEQYRAGKAPLFGGPWFNTLLHGDRLAVNVTRCGADALDPHAVYPRLPESAGGRPVPVG